MTVMRPPRVERIDLRYEFPAALGMPPRDEEDGGDIYGPAGTRVRVTRPHRQAGSRSGADADRWRANCAVDRVTASCKGS